MQLISLPFAGLTAGTLCLYYAAPRRFRFLVLLAASLVFAAFRGPWVLTGNVFNAGLCWLAGREIAKSGQTGQGIAKSGQAGQKEGARRWLQAALAVQLILFLAFHGRQPGLSYQVLMWSAYLLDVYRGRIPAETNPLRLASFGLFYPQGSQGPVSRYPQLGPQLAAGTGADWEMFTGGLRRILRGLLKKLVLADRLAVFVNLAYAGYEGLAGEALWLAVFFYSIQIYADFSGCMDIVLGTARLFGVELAENFRRPYLAGSVTEYWQRWHMTMGVWFREYLFYPLAVSGRVIRLGQRLAGKRNSERGRRMAAALCPLLLTWLATGLWHGLAGHYLLWGLANGLLILWEAGGQTPRRMDRGRTFLTVSLVRILFRADSVAAAWGFAGRLLAFGQGAGILSCGLDIPDLAVAAVGTCLMLLADVWQEKRGDGPQERQSWLLRWLLCLAGLAALLLFGMYGPGYDPAEFYYGRF